MLWKAKRRLAENPRSGVLVRLRNQEGYTLLELLIVMGILAALTAVATPQIMGYFGKAKIQTAHLQIENISTALEMYYVEIGSYPSTQAGLKALIEPPPEAPGWNGPYLTKSKTLLDPWGHPFQYSYAGSGNEYEIYSLGPSGRGQLRLETTALPRQIKASS